MHLVSHAHRAPRVHERGAGRGAHAAAGTTWLDQPKPDSGEEFKPPRLRQDMSALPALVDMGVAEFDALVKAGRIDPDTEHILCHYSAEHFRAKLLGRLRDAGYAPDDERWFTNLHTAGNTGAASIFVMLDAARDRMRPGDRVLLIVPESGRFTMAFAQLTCVGPDGGPSRAELARSPLGEPSPGDSPAVARCRRAGRGLGGTAAHPGQGAGRAADRGRLGDARGLPQAAAQPAPAGRRRRPVDLPGRRELLCRAVLAAQRRHQPRRR